MNVRVTLGSFTTLTLLFTILKLAGAISWSWLWVVSPLWIPLAIWVAVSCLALVFVLKSS